MHGLNNLKRNNMKQTAVEWLESQILEGSINIENGEMYIKLPKDALKKAKEMEKKDKHSEYMRGWRDGYSQQEPKSE